MSRVLFATAPVVVLADGHDSDALSHAADMAEQLTVPMLLAGDKPEGKNAEAVIAEVERLGARWVLPVGTAADEAAAALTNDDDDVQVAHAVDEIPDLPEAPALSAVAALVSKGAPKKMAAGVAAAKASAQAAGAALMPMAGGDPRADPDVITALSDDKLDAVIAIGPHVGSAKRLAARVATAETGVQLPGGGQVMFPGRTLVALYGYPGTDSLGVLGAQSLDASIKRAAKVADEYTKLVKGPVIPTFEIIATVATAGPGSDGQYSSQSSIKRLKPWVEKATKSGMYVVLDLQPGRTHLLEQAKLYTELLKMPAVGLALDPEWKLGPSQRPLQQIGGVDASEVNQVIDWLGDLVAKDHLPQKLLVLHQFRLSMLRNEKKIDTGNDDVAVLIHMDGQGAPNLKESTWNALLPAAPKGVWWGWKNFYVKDTPTMTPAQTMDRKPAPVMISYQ